MLYMTNFLNYTNQNIYKYISEVTLNKFYFIFFFPLTLIFVLLKCAYYNFKYNLSLNNNFQINTIRNKCK